ncbi:MAG: hypothetical protein ACT6FE_06150 [Methanosarcinaceae archaeon]
MNVPKATALAGGGEDCEGSEEGIGATNIMILLFDRRMRPSPRNKYRKPQ